MGKIIQCLKFAIQYVGVRADEAKNRRNMSEDTGIHDIRLSTLFETSYKTCPKALTCTELVTSCSHSPT